MRCLVGGIVGFLTLLASALPGDAQCGRAIVVNKSPVVVQKEVVAVTPVQKIVTQNVVVSPLVVAVPVDVQAVPVFAFNPLYYYSVGEAYQTKSYLREVIREELRHLQPPSAQEPQPQRLAPPPSGGQPSQKPASGGADLTTPSDLQKRVLAAFNGRAKCISCHGGDAPAGNLRLVVFNNDGTASLADVPADKRWKAYGMASAGLMPPTAAGDATKVMETEHLSALLSWAAQSNR